MKEKLPKEHREDTELNRVSVISGVLREPLCTLVFFIFCLFLFQRCDQVDVAAVYIDSENGDDSNPGTLYKPIRTIAELNSRVSGNPMNIYFSDGQTFDGTLVLDDIHGTSSNKMIVSTRGRTRAIINGGDSEAIRIENCSNIFVSDLRLNGSGRKNGNIRNGLSVINTTSSTIRNIRVSGFQKSGVELSNCIDLSVSDVAAYNNGFAGINVIGSSRDSSRNIIIKDCTAENNPGDPTNLGNHSGNGILVGVSDNVTIKRCSATRNGWDMPREGNGPVGIWAWESSNVTIEYCISYRNQTSKNAKDGGGFDLDGGVTNSVVRYCISFGNEGAGFGLFQYAGASDWTNNTIKNNISINDATTTDGAGSIFIWNGSHEKRQLSNCKIEKNIIVNFKAPLISFENDSQHENFEFSGNFFIGRDTVLGINSGSLFGKNLWIGRTRK